MPERAVTDREHGEPGREREPRRDAAERAESPDLLEDETDEHGDGERARVVVAIHGRGLSRAARGTPDRCVRGRRAIRRYVPPASTSMASIARRANPLAAPEREDEAPAKRDDRDQRPDVGIGAQEEAEDVPAP